MAPQAFTLTIQVKIHTQTGVGAHHLENHFKNKDSLKKGDGQFLNMKDKNKYQDKYKDKDSIKKGDDQF